MELTYEQKVQLLVLKSCWDEVSDPVPLMDGSGCAMVEVRSTETGISMVIGIERDGYAHS